MRAYILLVFLASLPVSAVIAAEPAATLPPAANVWRTALDDFTAVSRLIDAEKYADADQRLTAAQRSLPEPYREMARSSQQSMRRAFERCFDEKPDFPNARRVERADPTDPFGDSRTAWVAIDFGHRDAQFDGYYHFAHVARALGELQQYDAALIYGKRAVEAYRKSQSAAWAVEDDPEGIGSDLSRWLACSGAGPEQFAELLTLLPGPAAKATCLAREKNAPFIAATTQGYGLYSLKRIDQLPPDSHERAAKLASLLGLIGDDAGFKAWDKTIAEEDFAARDEIYRDSDSAAFRLGVFVAVDRWHDQRRRVRPDDTEFLRRLLIDRASDAESSRQYERALASFTALLTFKPQEPEYLLGMSRMLMRLGRHEESLKYSEQVIQQPPAKEKFIYFLYIGPYDNHREAAWNIVTAHQALGNVEQAYAFGQLAIDRFPPHSSCGTCFAGMVAREAFCVAQLASAAGKHELARAAYLELLGRGMLESPEFLTTVFDEYERTEGLQQLVTAIDDLAKKKADAWNAELAAANMPMSTVDGYSTAMKVAKRLAAVRVQRDAGNVEALWQNLIRNEIDPDFHNSDTAGWFKSEIETAIASMKERAQPWLRRQLRVSSPHEGRAIILLAKSGAPDALDHIRGWISRFDERNDDQRELATEYAQALLLIDTPQARALLKQVESGKSTELREALQGIRDEQKWKQEAKDEASDTGY